MTDERLDTVPYCHKRSYAQLLGDLRSFTGPEALTIVGIDGRGGSGKSFLAAAFAHANPEVSVVHTDDIAWHHSFFDWTGPLTEGILVPLRRQGPPVTYRPPAWIARGRSGAVNVPATAKVVIVEGAGVCRRDLQPWFDVTVWVHARSEVRRRRMLARGVDTPQFFDDWMTQENTFFAKDKPWTRADILINGEIGQPLTDGDDGGAMIAVGPSVDDG